MQLVACYSSMYLRCPQLDAYIDLKRVLKKSLPYSARYSVHSIKAKVQRRTAAARSIHTGLVQSDIKEVDLLPELGHITDRKSYAEIPAQGIADRDGSWRSRDLRYSKKRRLDIFRYRHHRPFATVAADRKSRAPAFGRRLRQGGLISTMARTGATRENLSFQFITTPTSDTPGTALLLHFDSKRYIFGDISEGTQRACVQRGIGLKKVKHIFLTGQVKWENTGGLIGMILTMADIQAQETEPEKLRFATMPLSENIPRISEGSSEQESLMIHGGENLLHTMACARKFVFRKGMPISINEFELSNDADVENPTWADEKIRVWAMPIAPSASVTRNNNDMESSDASASSLEPSPRSSSGRKRSHDQFKQGTDGDSVPDSPGQHLRNQELRRSIVSEMFNSRWHRDALFEKSLADVESPAALFVRDPVTKNIKRYYRPDGEELPPDMKVLVRNPWPGAFIEDLPPARDLGCGPAMSYIVQGFPQRGRFDPKKALALGVPSGPLCGSLTAGESVALKDGTIVTPEMVLGPTKPARGIAIIELPSRKYVRNLISRAEWRSDQIRNGIAAICWILGPNVASHAELNDFMRSMPDVEHIVSSADVCPDYLAFDSGAASAIRLSRVSESYFPVPFHDNVTLPQPKSKDGREADRLPSFIAADRGLRIIVKPQLLISNDEIPPLLNTAEVVRNLPQKVRELAALARGKVAAESQCANGTDTAGHREGSEFDPEIITLGTGSALPSKYRNVSATLLLTGKYGNFLFDCGENTIGQLRRVFDPPALRVVLRDLKFIWLSHLHSDHHLGTVSVLTSQRRAAATREALAQEAENIDKVAKPRQRVVVASGSKMLKFLTEYASVENIGNVQQLAFPPYQAPISADSETTATSILEQLGVKHLKATPVDHCSDAQAITVVFANGFKFSYSGDCRPSVSFAAAGKGSDVLVHEATFDDGMEGDAMAKRHCTTGEALGVAAKMEAKNVILTHFSQRYQKLPVLKNVKLPSSNREQSRSWAEEPPAFLGEQGETGAAAESALTTSDSKPVLEENSFSEMAEAGATVFEVPKLDMNICVAFDYMRVRVSDIKHMRKFTPALTALFDTEQDPVKQSGCSPTSKKRDDQSSKR